MKPSPGLARTQARWLIDVGTVTRPDQQTFDDTDGSYTVTAVEVWSGPCHVTRFAGSRKSDAEVATVEESLVAYAVTLPQDADGIEVHDVFTLTDSAEHELVGVPLVVADVQRHSWNVDRRLIVQDRTRR